VGLEIPLDAVAHTLSGGQRRILSFLAAFVNDPDLVLLDEPTSAMDPVARRQCWQFLRKVSRAGPNSGGKVICLSTHLLEEADKISDRVAILKQGRMVSYGSPHFLKATSGCGYSLDLSLRLFPVLFSDQVLQMLNPRPKPRGNMMGGMMGPPGMMGGMSGMMGGVDDEFGAEANDSTNNSENPTLKSVATTRNLRRLLDSEVVPGLKRSIFAAVEKAVTGVEKKEIARRTTTSSRGSSASSTTCASPQRKTEALAQCKTLKLNFVTSVRKSVENSKARAVETAPGPPTAAVSPPEAPEAPGMAKHCSQNSVLHGSQIYGCEKNPAESAALSSTALSGSCSMESAQFGKSRHTFTSMVNGPTVKLWAELPAKERRALEKGARVATVRIKFPLLDDGNQIAGILRGVAEYFEHFEDFMTSQGAARGQSGHLLAGSYSGIPIEAQDSGVLHGNSRSSVLSSSIISDVVEGEELLIGADSAIEAELESEQRLDAEADFGGQTPRSRRAFSEGAHSAALYEPQCEPQCANLAPMLLESAQLNSSHLEDVFLKLNGYCLFA